MESFQKYDQMKQELYQNWNSWQTVDRKKFHTDYLIRMDAAFIQCFAYLSVFENTDAYWKKINQWNLRFVKLQSEFNYPWI